MNIQDTLKQYKTKKAKVEATKARIQAWERILLDPNIEFYGYKLYSREIGMPSAHSATSQVEREAFQSDNDDEVTKEMIEEWIKEDKSRISPLEIEVEQIEKAIEGLTTWEQFIIKCKYFESMYWCNVELSFNEQFHPKNYIPSETLKDYSSKAISKLIEILEPFYRVHSKTA